MDDNVILQATPPTKVTRRLNRRGDKWVYVAHLDDEQETEVIIRRSPRRYDRAYFYNTAATSGNKMGLSVQFTFGAKPSRYHIENLTRVYQIEETIP